jgi:hypothetical protein
MTLMPPSATGAQQSGITRLDPARLAAANINPKTGLATDFLNHFNEGIMLLEMLPCAPECAEDFVAWSPMTYQEHFQASNFKDRDLAIEAYDAADPASRRALDEITLSLNAILIATREAIEIGLTPESVEKLSNNAVGWLKPLVARAGAVINGNSTLIDQADAPQAAVDALFAN